MSVKGIIMFLGMNNTRLERKILMILDFENGFLPTYLPQCIVGGVVVLNGLRPKAPRADKSNFYYTFWPILG